MDGGSLALCGQGDDVGWTLMAVLRCRWTRGFGIATATAWAAVWMVWGGVTGVAWGSEGGPAGPHVTTIYHPTPVQDESGLWADDLRWPIGPDQVGRSDPAQGPAADDRLESLIVPEPTAVLFLAIGAVLLAMRRPAVRGGGA